ncbi:MAG: aminotransferase class V-fold PLP-dependent enzyme, partial [Candidatus Geothermarchaeales archaeon]
VDAYQSVGAIKVDVEEAGVDFLCTGSSKWLMGPPGAGFLYVREEVAEKLQAPIPSWLYGRDVFDLSPGGFEDLRGASKFETGTPNYLGYAGTLASIKKISQYGIENVEKRILSLTQWLIEELIKMGLEVVTPRKRDRRAGIILFKTKVDPVKVIQGLREEGIIVWKRGGLGVRASIHYINREDEVNYFIETLKDMNRRGLL